MLPKDENLLLLKLKRDLPAKHAKGREKREFQKFLPTISKTLKKCRAVFVDHNFLFSRIFACFAGIFLPSLSL